MGDWDLTVSAWREVLKELQETELFRGIYHTHYVEVPYMNGIRTVMKVIAEKAHDKNADKLFEENMIASKDLERTL